MDVVLRRAKETDIPFLLGLRKSTMTEHLEAAGILLSEAEHESRVREEFGSARIIEYSGKRVGMAKYRETEHAIEVLQVQILPDHQGRGLGRHVVESLVETAVRQRKRLTLAVLKANPAKRLYERLGFRVVDEDEHEFHMQYGA